MTKKEFKYAMQRGLGSCVVELENAQDIEKYQPIVLWGCARDTAYDTQCEGSRGFYLCELITQFSDKTPFFDVIEQSLYKYMGSTRWEFAQDIELLGFFAGYENADNTRAKAIMKDCYDALFQILLKKRRRTKHGLLPECDNFERLCLVIADICSKDRMLLMEQYKKWYLIWERLSKKTGYALFSTLRSFKRIAKGIWEKRQYINCCIARTPMKAQKHMCVLWKRILIIGKKHKKKAVPKLQMKFTGD